MQTYIAEARKLLTVAIPVIFAQIAQTAMGVVDTLMSGKVSKTDLAAVALGTSIWLPAILFAHGLLLALTPTVAQLNGAGKRSHIAQHTRQAYWIAFFTSPFIMLILWNADYLIHIKPNVDPQMAEIAVRYLRALTWGVPGYLCFQVVRDFCEGLSKTKPGMYISFLGLALNIPLNYIFINGHFGMPALGGAGCGVATSACFWFMFITMKFWAGHAASFRDIRLSSYFSPPNFAIIYRLFSQGLPVALALFFEVTLFAVIAILVSPLGVVSVAGHQIALNFSSLMFVFPMSVAVAATIRIGNWLGEHNTKMAQVSAWTAQGIGALMVVVSATVTVALRHQIARLYNTDPEVVTLASRLMLLAGIYQISDSIQMIGGGVLRGYKDTRPIFFITLISYWIVGLPIGYLFALTPWFGTPTGTAGFWYGIIMGLTCAAIMLVWRTWYIQRRPEATILKRAAE